MPKKSPPDKPAAHDKPVVHFTKQGDRYVDAGELLRSDAAKKAIESMMEIDNKGSRSRNTKKD